MRKHPGTSGFTRLEQDSDVNNLLDDVIKIRGKRGSFGAYTISTLLNLMSLKDYTLRY